MRAPRRCRTIRPSNRRKTNMKIHEYQAKEILRKYGVATPRGIPCFSVDEAVKAAREVGGKTRGGKEQNHPGGRGQGGGVKVGKTPGEKGGWAREVARQRRE